MLLDLFCSWTVFTVQTCDHKQTDRLSSELSLPCWCRRSSCTSGLLVSLLMKINFSVTQTRHMVLNLNHLTARHQQLLCHTCSIRTQLSIWHDCVLSSPQPRCRSFVTLPRWLWWWDYQPEERRTSPRSSRATWTGLECQQKVCSGQSTDSLQILNVCNKKKEKKNLCFHLLAARLSQCSTWASTAGRPSRPTGTLSSSSLIMRRPWRSGSERHAAWCIMTRLSILSLIFVPSVNGLQCICQSLCSRCSERRRHLLHKRGRTSCCEWEDNWKCPIHFF